MQEDFASLRRAITFVEVLCVVGIVCSLAALAYPVFAESRRAAKVGVCLVNLGQIQRALRLYSLDFDDVVPRGKDCVDAMQPKAQFEHVQAKLAVVPMLNILVDTYGLSGTQWMCPLDRGTKSVDTLPELALDASPSLFAVCGMSYRYVTSLGDGATWTSLGDRVSTQMILSDQAGHWHTHAQPLNPNMVLGDFMALWQEYRYNVAYFDGHVERNRTYYQVRDASGVAQ